MAQSYACRIGLSSLRPRGGNSNGGVMRARGRNRNRLKTLIFPDLIRENSG
jgi:hypothetical protein